MVESVAKLAQVQREEFPRHAAQRMQLGFRRAPEPFDAVEGITPVGSAALFAPADMVTADGERGLSVPVIGGGEATGPGMGLDPFNYRVTVPSLDRHPADQSVALQDPQHEDCTGRAPAAFARACASNGRFIALDGASERLTSVLSPRTPARITRDHRSWAGALARLRKRCREAGPPARTPPAGAASRPPADDWTPRPR